MCVRVLARMRSPRNARPAPHAPQAWVTEGVWLQTMSAPQEEHSHIGAEACMSACVHAVCRSLLTCWLAQLECMPTEKVGPPPHGWPYGKTMAPWQPQHFNHDVVVQHAALPPNPFPALAALCLWATS